MNYVGTREQNYSYATCVSQTKAAYGAIMVHTTFFWCCLFCCWQSGLMQNPSKSSWNFLIRIDVFARSLALFKLVLLFSSPRLLFFLTPFEPLS